MKYEFAILQNKLHKIPVAPVFLSEIEEVNGKPEHTPFDTAKALSSLPHEVHARGQSVQDSIDKLRY
jgi:hypothetical protein